MIFMLSLFALAGAAGCLGAIVGLAYGIEVEKKVKRPPPVLAEGEVMAQEESA